MRGEVPRSFLADLLGASRSLRGEKSEALEPAGTLWNVTN